MLSHHKKCNALHFKWPFTAILIFFSTPSLSVECIATGPTRSQAVNQFNRQCVLPRKDCDLIDGLWYCSTERITSTGIRSSLRPPPPPPEIQEATSDVNSLPYIDDEPVCHDPDGDGWGWDGSGSCKVSSIQFSAIPDLNLELDQPPGNPQPDSTAVCIDSDGDGWGWNGIASCRASVQSLGSAPIDTTVVNRPSPVLENCQKLRSGDYHITELVTDVFLTAGQSNATGGGTRYSPETNSKDRVNNRVLAWTENDEWEVANPRTQIWHNGKYPGGYHISNHPAFQIGRAIADQDECRVVAFIATAASGMPIDHWRHDQENHYSDTSNKVTHAINALPGKHHIDMIWWMQGEADNDQIVSRYVWKLNDLISKFRSESWFNSDGYFLANETGWSMFANSAIRTLRNDDDPYTDFGRGEDSPFDIFPNISSELRKVHFNESALRKIGDLVADKYLDTKARWIFD